MESTFQFDILLILILGLKIVFFIAVMMYYIIVICQQKIRNSSSF